LTKADLASNEIICKALSSLEPDIPIISEENDETTYSIRKEWDYCWIVDPLDGTKEFLKRNGEFTTNIGLVYKQNVIAGIVYLPVTDEMYYAVRGEGAFKIVAKKTEKITAQEFRIQDNGLKVVCSRSHLDERTQHFIDSLKEPTLVNKGSSLKFMTIAQGDADLYPRMAPTMEWDTCAAQIILEEAGGSVMIEGSNNEPVVYNKEILKNPYFIAKGKEVF
jgi:3'(2'), 5'-bisphosphate nucleotidase